MKLCKATAGMGVPVSVSPHIGATCPIIIFESADINSAVDDVLETAFKKKKEVSRVAAVFVRFGCFFLFVCFFANSLVPSLSQAHWVLCVQESVLDSAMARLRLRMAGLKCVSLPGDGVRTLVETAVQDAQNKGATVGRNAFAQRQISTSDAFQVPSVYTVRLVE